MVQMFVHQARPLLGRQRPKEGVRMLHAAVRRSVCEEKPSGKPIIGVR
jgi:hypothetical protein